MALGAPVRRFRLTRARITACRMPSRRLAAVTRSISGRPIVSVAVSRFLPTVSFPTSVPCEAVETFVEVFALRWPPTRQGKVFQRVSDGFRAP